MEKQLLILADWMVKDLGLRRWDNEDLPVQVEWGDYQEKT